MKTKREMPLAEALKEISSTVQRLTEDGAARVNGYEVKLDEPVQLEIETEAEKGTAEIEFEIKWPVKRRRRGRRLLLGALAGAAIGAAALAMMRRRHGSEEGEEI